MTAARNVAAIVQKEWRHYFGSPIAWVALFFWTLLFGVFFSVNVFYFVKQSAMGAQQMEMGPKMSLNDQVIRWVFHNVAVVALFVLPMLTMRLFAEEKRQGTIELLATLPITDWQVVIGKFLGAASLYLLMIASGLLDFSMLWIFAPTPPEWKPLATGALALFLMGGSFIALGLFISTLTRNQIVAGIVTFGLSLCFWVLSWFDEPTADATMKVIGYLGITNHMEDMVKGILDLKDVVFYLSFIAFGLFLAHQSVESQRWRA